MQSRLPISELTDSERKKFVRVLQSSVQVNRHSELFLWLQGELQHFLPHDILIVVSGDFITGDLSFDVVSALPDVRTDNLHHCNIREFTKRMHQRWLSLGRKMFTAHLKEKQCLNTDCNCDFRNTMCQMRSVWIHGTRDERSGYDALYVMMHNQFHDEERYQSMLELMMPHIDVASQRITSLPMACAKGVAIDNAHKELERIGITKREEEILEWLTMGKTNSEIAIIVNISAFTVKNHLQRIFKKLDVLNRVQAVEKIGFLKRAARLN